MTVSSHAVANRFIEIAANASVPLTNMQLQKLVYITNGYSLALNSCPMYFDETHAWQFGPVIPRLYKPLRKYGNSFVTDPLCADDRLEDDTDLDIVEAVWKRIRSFLRKQAVNPDPPDKFSMEHYME